MGVLHMAIPFSGFQTARPPAPVRAIYPTPQPDPTPAQPSSTSPVVLPAPHPAPHDTLPSSRKAPEVRLQRTPEQQAEQDILTALVGRCVAGDQGAWHRLVTSQHSRIYAICYRFLGNQTEAEDATQDVFLKIYRNLPSFDPGKGSLQTWITTLTRNLLVDGFRRSKLERASESLDVSLTGEEDGPTQLERLPDTRPGQDQQFAGLELKARIQHALTQLSAELREAVILRDLEDLDYKEIALVLKIPEGTVKSRISRGRAELGRLLQRMEGQVV